MNSARRIRVGWVVAFGLALMLLGGFLYLQAGKSTAQDTELPKSAGVTHHAPPRALAALAPPVLGSIAGRVLNASGAPIPGALVCASRGAKTDSLDQDAPSCVAARQDGSYLIAKLSPSRFSLVASAAEYRPSSYRAANRSPLLQLHEGQHATGVDFVLKAGGVEVRGYVKDLGGGSIAGALVALRGWMDQGTVFTLSQEDGSFSAWAEEGQFFASASADGYAEGRSVGMAPGPECEILLTPGSVLVGRVVEANSGRPIVATVFSGTDQFGHLQSGSVQTDAEGRFRISGLPPGRYKPSARAAFGYGQARESVRLGIAETSREVTLELHAAPSVKASVLVAPGNEPCPSGSVSLLAPGSPMRQTTIESEGAVSFEGMSPGTYRVHVDCDDHAAPENYPSLIVADADIAGIVWTVQQGVTLRGRVVSSEEQPVRATVHAARLGGAFGFGAPVQNDDEGYFVLRGLLPGKVRVTAIPKDHVPPAPVEVELGTSPPELIIVVQSGGAVVGRVTDPRGRPVSGAQIAIVGQAPHRWQPPMSSLSDGTFELKGLAPGDYQVSAAYGGTAVGPFSRRKDEPSLKSVSVKVGTTTQVQLVLAERSGEITGRVVDENQAPVVDAFVQAVREAEGPELPSVPPWESTAPVLSDREGAFALTHLAEGTYTVHAYREGGGSASVEHVKLGSTVTVAIQRTATLSGRLEMAGGGSPDEFTVGVSSPEARLFRRESFVHTSGAWTISDLPEGNYQLFAEAPEGTAALELVLTRGETRSDIVLTLAPRATLRGRVSSLEDGSAVIGARVSAFSQSAMAATTSTMDPAVTGEAGQFELANVSIGAVTLLVMPGEPLSSAQDPAVVPFEVEPGKSGDVGSLLVARRRLKPGQPAGDLGFALTELPPVMQFRPRTLEVGSVRPHGPAALAGLLVGDVIVAVDGHDVTGKLSYLYRTLASVPAGTSVALRLARGATLALEAGASLTPSMPGPSSARSPQFAPPPPPESAPPSPPESAPPSPPESAPPL